MAIDTRDKRASCLGIGLPFLAVLPTPDGTVSGGDLYQLAYSYRLIDIGGVRVVVRQVTDTLGLTDTRTPERQRTRFRQDVLTLSDQLRRLTARVREARDTASLADSLKQLVTRMRETRDLLGVYDATLKQVFHTSIVRDLLSVYDLALRQVSKTSTARDTADLADRLASTVLRMRDAADWVPLFDSVTSEITLGGPEYLTLLHQLTTVLELYDTVFRQIARTIQLWEWLGLYDRYDLTVFRKQPKEGQLRPRLTADVLHAAGVWTEVIGEHVAGVATTGASFQRALLPQVQAGVVAQVGFRRVQRAKTRP